MHLASVLHRGRRSVTTRCHGAGHLAERLHLLRADDFNDTLAGRERKVVAIQFDRRDDPRARRAGGGEYVAKTESSTSAPNQAVKLTPRASTSSENALKPSEKNIDSISYVGFVQQLEFDEDEDGEVDFGDDEIFSSYVSLMKKQRT